MTLTIVTTHENRPNGDERFTVRIAEDSPQVATTLECQFMAQLMPAVQKEMARICSEMGFGENKCGPVPPPVIVPLPNHPRRS